MVKIDYAKLSKDLGDIPTKKDVLKLCRYIESIKWFKPQKKLDKINLKLKINSIIKAFKLDFSCDLEFHKLESYSDWASARDSARVSARDSAWASAWDSAWASAWDSARVSARVSARDSAWDSAWVSARVSARDSAWASAWDSARDSAWASAFEVVKDLMKAKGYEKNPFKELLEIWNLGLYPIGLLKDKKFHIYYIPLKKWKEKKK